MTDLENIGETLRAARLARRLTQKDLGRLVGVKQQQIARWEAASYRSATVDRVLAVAGALGVGQEPAIGTPFGHAAGAPLLAAEPGTAYGEAPPAVLPVRDLGEIAARIREHGREFVERYEITRIGVFGSFAVGEQTPTSDVDLLVEVEHPGGFRFIEAADFAEEVLGRRVDFVRPQGLSERFLKRVLKEVVYVWSA